MVTAIGTGWRGGPRLLYVAPGVPLGVWVRCTACGRIANGHWMGRRHHVETYHKHEKPLPRFVPTVDPKRMHGQN